MRIAVYGSKRQESSAEQIRLFLDNLRRRGATAVMHRKLYNHLYGFMPRALAAVGSVVDGNDFEADLAVSLGGDGTFLRTAAWIGASGTAVAGVNTGRLGYLTATGIDGLPGIADAFAAGRLEADRRSLIEVTAPHLDMWPYALNEVALLKNETSSMIDVHATVDGHMLAQYRVDGLLVSTPTGSTAYNLSVGGPIVQPSAPVWVVAPVAPHSLSMRPLVLNDSSELMLQASSRAPHVRLSIDGRAVSLDAGTRICLRRAAFSINVLHPAGYHFAATLRDKLHWE